MGWSSLVSTEHVCHWSAQTECRCSALVHNDTYRLLHYWYSLMEWSKFRSINYKKKYGKLVVKKKNIKKSI